MNEGISKLDFTPKMAVPHQHSSKAPQSKKKAIRQRPQGSGFPLKASVSGSKGEGWMPILVESASICHDFKCKEIDVGSAGAIAKELSEESMDATSKKELEVMVSPSIKQSLVCSTSIASCSLEMMDASNSTWKDNKGLEMCDSSHLKVVHNDLAKLGDNAYTEARKFWDGIFIAYLGLHSSSFFLVEVSRVIFQSKFQTTTVSLGVSTTPFLRTFCEEDLFGVRDSLKQKQKGSQIKEEGEG